VCAGVCWREVMSKILKQHQDMKLNTSLIARNRYLRGHPEWGTDPGPPLVHRIRKLA
jgi:hypothetical protein